jgi:hypothetical protein
MTETGWNHMLDEEKSRIICMAVLQKARLIVQVLVVQEQQLIRCRIALERRCPKQFLGRLAEACNQFNWIGLTGTFSLDFRDGEVVFRHCVSVEGIDITPTFVDNLLKTCVKVVGNRIVSLHDLLCGATVELEDNHTASENAYLQLLRLLLGQAALSSDQESGSASAPSRQQSQSTRTAGNKKSEQKPNPARPLPIVRSISNPASTDPPPRPDSHVAPERPANVSKAPPPPPEDSSCCIMV